MGVLRTDLRGVVDGASVDGPARLEAAVVALNPWLYPTDNPDLTGCKVLIVHGSKDRIARPERSVTVANSLRRHTEVRYVVVAVGKHAMLGRHTTFDTLAADFAAATCSGQDSV